MYWYFQSVPLHVLVIDIVWLQRAGDMEFILLTYLQVCDNNRYTIATNLEKTISKMLTSGNKLLEIHERCVQVVEDRQYSCKKDSNNLFGGLNSGSFRG